MLANRSWLSFAAFAKQGVRFIEKEHYTTLSCRMEDAPQILLGLANVFGDDGAQIDAVQVFSEIAGQCLGGHEGAHPVSAGEQDANAFSVRQLANGLALCLRTAFCANECHHIVQGCSKSGRQSQLGFDPVLRITKDFPISVPDAIIFARFAFCLRFAELSSLLPGFFHSHHSSTMSGACREAVN